MTSSGESDQPQTVSKSSPLAILGVLRVLVQTKKAKTTKDLIRYAQQAKAKKDVVDRLLEMDAENIPLELAYDTISVHLRLEAHRSSSTLMQGCAGKKIALILPVPPHVVSLFESVGEMSMLMSGETQLSGFFEHYREQIKHGGRACREVLATTQVVVFEGYREAGKLFADSGAADLLEAVRTDDSVQIIAHFRPHRSVDDVELSMDPKRVNAL